MTVIALVLAIAGATWWDQHQTVYVKAAVATQAAPGPALDDLGKDFARVAPLIDVAEPSADAVPVASAIVISFTQPMARASVERSFTITPRVYGRLTWQDDLTLSFQPFRLVHGTAYQVAVGGRSTRGVPLTGTTSWTFTTAPGPPLEIQPGANSINVPILMYHYIQVSTPPSDRLGFALSVTPTDFAAQMDWLTSTGYHPITLSDLEAYLHGAVGLPSHPVILTFDDGYEDFYTRALPILKAHDFVAVAYIVSGFVGRDGYMNAAQVIEADHSGIEIGSHSVSHANLSRLSWNRLRVEVAASKEALEQLLGHPVLSFCYPSGMFNPTVVGAVQAAGYQDATTTAFGYVHALADRYAWSRVRVSGGESLDYFAQAVRTAS
jgi:peptidoglycan/xylan/chitin deacetylase (PgdA/CDA1 family)